MKKKFLIPMIIHFTIIFLIICNEVSLFHGGRWAANVSVAKLISILSFFPYADLTYWLVFRKYSFLKSAIVALLAVVFWEMLVYVLNIMIRSDFILIQFNLVDVKTTGLLTAYLIGYSFGRKYIDRLFYLKEMQLEKTKNALDVLKAHLNPHFFFNSLNYLYGTALAEKAERTSQSIIILSDMMRYTISGTKENFVPLTDELKFIKDYTYLQQVRLPQKDSIKVEINITEYNGEEKIAPMLLLPFIENAYKYGISIDALCYIQINITFFGNNLRMEVRNSVKEYFETTGNNTDIINTRKRLDLLYKNKYTLDCKKTYSAYTATLSVELYAG